jgi:hypothetical protein
MQQLLSDDIEIHFVEIPKLVKQWCEEKTKPLGKYICSLDVIITST